MPRQRTLTRTFLGRRSLAKAAVATVVGALLAASAVVPAQAATGDVTAAEGSLLSGSGIVNLNNIAALGTAYSSTNASTTGGTASNPLDLTAVNALGVNLGNGVQLLGNNGILTLGAAGQYANTTPTAATAASGVVGADGTIAVGSGTPGNASSLNLTPLLSRVGAATAVASAAQLNIGAIASRIQEQRGATTSTTTDYGIAGANFTVTSPAVAGLNTSLQTSVNGIGSALNNQASNSSALNGVVSGSTGDLTTALNALIPGTLTLSGTTLTTTISGLNLGAVTAPVLARTYTSGPVTVNPSTGQIVIDLNTLQALNGQPANTQLLSTTALQSLITAALQDILVSQIPAALNTAVVTAIGNATITANLGLTVALAGLNVTRVNATITTTLGNLLATTGRAPLTVNATGTALGLAGVGINLSSATLNPALQPVVDGTLAPLLANVFQPTVTAIPATLAAVTTPVNTTVSALNGILNQLVSITVNAQDTSTGFRDARGTDAGAQSVHAISLSVLPALAAARVDLATSTVNATTIAPVAITAPTAGQQFTVATSTSTRTVTVTGTGEPGASIAVDLGQGRTGSGTVAADGTWSAPVAGVGVGSVTASVTQTLGTITSGPVTRAFTVVAQQPLVITTPTEGRAFTVVSSSATTPVTVSGTATPGASIALTLGASGITGSVTAAADGTWTTNLTNVPVGSYTVSATQTSGGLTSAVVTRGFSVAAGAPLTVTAPTDGTRVVVPGSGSTTTVTVTGTAQPNAAVNVSLGGGLTGTATAAADGSYSIPVSGVGVGSYTVSVTQTVGGVASDPITRALTVAAASPLVIQTPIAGAQFRVAGAGSTAPVTLTGTAQAGAAVAVQSAPGISTTVTADVTGNWSAPFSSVPVGSYTASVTQTVAGTTSAAATRAFAVVQGDPVVIQTPAVGATNTVASPTSTRPVTVSGTAEAGSSVTVTLASGVTATVPANATTGAWTTTFTDVPVGDYQISATETFNATTSAPVTRAYSIKAAAPVTITAPDPAVDVVVASPGALATIPVAGTAQPNSTVTVTIGGTTVTTTSAASGAWSVPVTGVAPGTYTIQASQTVGGTTSTPVTQPLTVRVGDPIAITSPAPGTEVTVFGQGGTTPVVVTGTAQAGATVVARLGTGLTATTTATSTGAWTARIDAVPVGDYSLSATQTTGGTSSTTASREFSVVVGGAIVITRPATGTTYFVADSGTLRPTTTVSGRADDNAAVTVTVTPNTGSPVTLPTTALADGTWSVEFPDLASGTYTVTARQTVGGVSDDATATSFSIAAGDPIAVATPVAGTTYRVADASSRLPVTITGTAQANATITVLVGGQTLTTTASSGGMWAVVADGTSNGSGSGLATGDYTVRATQTTGGTTSTAPATTNFSIVAGADFAISTPIAGTELSVADDAATVTVPVTGTGEPGASVAVTYDGVTKTVTADPITGTWATSFANVGVGSPTFTAQETVGTTTGPILSRSITVSSAADVTVTTPASGDVVTVADAASTTDVTVTGSAEPNAPVTVRLGVGTAQTVTANGAGAWTATFADLGVGGYTVSATQSVGGTVSAAVTSSFSVEAGDPVVITAPADGSRIVVADGSAVIGVPVSGTAEAGAEIVVDIDGQTAETTAAANGSWSVTVPGVDVGEHTISVTQTVGETTSAAVTSTVTVAAGAALVITAPRADATITVADATSTVDVPVSGTAQPGAAVSVRIGTGTPRTITADGSGNWSTTFADIGVAATPYELHATQTVGGTTSAIVDRSFRVTAGAAVTIDEPTPGAPIIVANDQATVDIAVTGSAEPGATVTAEIPGGASAAATAGSDGSYELTLENVPTGTHDIEVRQTVGGTTSADPTTVTVTDPTADSTLLVGTTGETVDVSFSGKGQPGADITVSLGGGLTATTTVGDDGSWNLTVESVPVGDQTATATQTVNGIDSPVATRDFTVAVADRVTVTAPTSGASLPVATPTTTTDVDAMGTAQPNTTVRVSLDGGTAVEIQANGAGVWSHTFEGVAVGPHRVSATQVLDNGPSTPVVRAFTVDTADAVTISTPQADQEFQVGQGDAATVPVTGTGTPGATVSVTLDGGTALTDTVGAAGSWSVTFSNVGPSDAHEISVVQIVGGVPQTAVGVTFAVTETQNPVAPVVIGSPTQGDVIPDTNGDGLVDVPVSGTGEPGSMILVDLGDGHTATTTVGDDGTWNATVTDVPVGPITIVVTQTTGTTVTSSDSTTAAGDTVEPAAITAPTAGKPLYVSSDDAMADVVVSGTGEPGAGVTVSLGAGLTDSVTVDDDGTWSATVSGVPVGTSTITVSQTVDGVTLPNVTQPLQVRVADPVTVVNPKDGATVVTPGSGDTASLPVSGTAQPGAVVTVTLDDDTTKTVTAASDGTWSVTFTGVPAGDHTVTASQALADGDTAPVSGDVTVRPAATLAITAPQTDQQIQVGTGETPNVVVQGSGEPGATVRVTLNGTPAVTATVSALGTWSHTFTAVAPGNRTVTATQTVGGVAGDPVSVPFAIVQKANPIAAPTITSPTAGQIVRDDDGDGFFDVLVQGTGQPGSSILVDLGDGRSRTVTVGDNGQWSTTVTGIPDGTATIVVTQTTGTTVTGSATATVTGSKAAPIAITTPTAGQSIAAPVTGNAVVTVQGTAEPGATIRLRLDNGTVLTATASGAGAWSIALNGVAPGSHTVSATETVGAATSAPTSVTFTVVKQAPTSGITVLAPADDALIVDFNADGTENVTVNGIATPNSAIAVVLDDGTTLTTTAGADGTWSVRFARVATGLHTLLASQTINGVTTTAPSQDFAIMDVEPLTVTSPAPGSAFLAGRDGTASVTITGTAHPDATITVMLDDGRIVTTTADDAGAWSVMYASVAQGQHAYTVTQTVGGFTSDPVTIAFSILRNPAINTGGSGDGTGGGSGSGGSGNGSGTGGSGTGSGSGNGTTSPAGTGGTSDPGHLVDGVLAFTGSTVLPWAVVGAGILALGLGMLGASRGLSRIRARRR